LFGVNSFIPKDIALNCIRPNHSAQKYGMKQYPNGQTKHMKKIPIVFNPSCGKDEKLLKSEKKNSFHKYDEIKKHKIKIIMFIVIVHYFLLSFT
jgi:hypothetical protein